MARNVAVSRLLRILVLLVGSLGLLVGCDAPTRPQRSSPFDAVAMTATLTGEGELTLTTRYTLTGSETTKIRLDPPVVGRVRSVVVDGDPVRVESGMLIVDVPGPSAVVETRMEGVVERTDDTAWVRFPLWRQTGVGRVDDPFIALSVELKTPETAARADDDALWLGVRDPLTTRSGDRLGVTGVVHPERNATAVVALDPAAFPTVPVGRAVQPGSKREARVFASVQRTNDAFFTRADAARRRNDVVAVGYWALILIEILLPLMIAAIGALRFARRRARAARVTPPTVSEPPDTPSPEVASLLVAGGNRLGGNAVAASVLDLIGRNLLEVENVTSEVFRLRPRPVDQTSVTPAEHALLAELARRVSVDADGWLDSPVALVRSGRWWQTYRRDVARRARQEGLLARRFPPALFVVCVIALAFTSAPLWISSPLLAAAALVTGMVLLALSALGGFRLTDAGLESRARWMAFEAHAATSTGLREASVPALSVWGPHLVAAAALGIATPAIQAISTPRRPRRQNEVGTVLLGPLLALAVVACGLLASAPAPAPAPMSASSSDQPACSVGERRTFRSRLTSDRSVPRELSGADLQCEDLRDLDFGQVDLTGADLRRADLRGASFTQAEMADAQLRGVDARAATFGQATLRGADLRDAQLRGADFTQADLTTADLRAADAATAKFGQAALGLADLRGTDASGADFTQTELVRVDASGAVFDRATFTQADLGESDFTGASLRAASLDVSEAPAAIFVGADVTDARWLSQLTSAGADLGGAVDEAHGGLDRGWVAAGGIVLAVAVLLGFIVRRSRSLSG